MGKYRYLLWDVDGTLVNFELSERRAIRALFKKYGFGDCPDDMLARYSAINTRYWKALERGDMTRPFILVERFREFFSSEHLNASCAEAFNTDYQAALGDFAEAENGALKLLTELHKDYVQVAVTNGSLTAQNKKLAVTGLNSVFDNVFISEVIGFEKPDIRYFEHVFSALDITCRNEALIIGDSLTSDIKGGINAGIDTCLYDPAGKYTDAESTKPGYIIHRLEEITEIIK